MKSLLVALALLLMWVGTADSKNVFIGTNGIASIQPTNCPFALDNGCAAAPLAQVGSTAIILGTSARNPGGWLNEATASPLNFASVGPDENLCGIEYACGETIPVSSMIDPATSVPAGCTYVATGNVSGGPLINCVYPTFTALTGYNLDVVGGHRCTALDITGSGGNGLVSQNLIRNGDASCAQATGPFQVRESTTGASVTLYINNTFDGNGLATPITTFMSPYGSCAAPTQCNPAIETFAVNECVTFKYNAFINYVGRPFQYNNFTGSPTCLFTMTQNFMSGSNTLDVTSHAELTEYANLAMGQVITGNTVIVPTSHMNVGLSAFPGQFANNNPAEPIFDIEDNFNVTGASGGIAPGATVAGTVSGNPSTFTVTSISGGLMNNGTQMLCPTNGSVLSFATQYNGLSGTTSAGIGGGGSGGNGSKWATVLVDAFVTAFVDDGSAYPSPSGIPGSVLSVTADNSMDLTIPGMVMSGLGSLGNLTVGTQTNVIVAGGTGQYNITGASLPGVAASTASARANPVDHLFGWHLPAGITSPSCVPVNGTITVSPFGQAIMADETGSYFTQITHKNNYIDGTIFGSGSAVWKQRTGVNSFSGSITGTTLTVSGLTGSLAISTGQSLIGSGLATVPTIVSGSGTTWTISAPVTGTVTGTMSTSQTGCANLSIFSGNVDMSGLIANPNQYNGDVPGNGCV